MKKTIYSIVMALILSVILTALTPKWLFKGDARWTYQNNEAGVDVSLSGHMKNGHVKAKGANMRITQPSYMSDKNYQGSVIKFSTSYREKPYQVELRTKADEWGEDTTLVLKFKGGDLQHRGKRRPAWVRFRNITLNGKTLAENKVVWHDKPFILKFPLHSSKVTLAFSVSKPIAASDFSFKNILSVFLVVLVLTFVFALPNSVTNHLFPSFTKQDIVKFLFNAYHQINPVYRRSFWIIFGVICCAFGFHTICFMWGNHDWALLFRKIPWLAYSSIGRYMVHSVKVSLLDGLYLPLIHDLLTFMILAINAVLLCRYWRLEMRVIYFVLCGLILTAQPFTLCMIYFVHMTPEVFIGVTCALIALLLSEKIALTGVPLKKKIVYSIIAIILINFSLAMYPVLLNTIAVAFSGRLLVHSFDWDGSWRHLKSCLIQFVISAINIISGTAIYKLVITYVFPIAHTYNTDILPINQVPERLGILLRQCVHQLYEYNHPFISQWILWVFLGFTIILTLYICATGNLQQRIVRLLLLCGSLFATQTAMIAAKTHVINGRIEIFGLVFFEVLVSTLIFTRFRRLHNLWIITGVCVVFASIINDLDCLRVWKFGFDAEKMLWNRVLARMEIQKEFDPNKKYDIVQIGWSFPMRFRYHTGAIEKFTGYAHAPSLLSLPFDAHGRPFMAHDFYYPTSFRRLGFSRFDGRVSSGYEARLKRLYLAGVLQKAEVWPKPNGLIVWKDIILFVTEEKELNYIKRKCERELGKR